jgi:hypothetical protein
VWLHLDRPFHRSSNHQTQKFFNEWSTQVFARKIIALGSGAVLLAGGIAAVAANAGSPADSVACAVVGQVTVSNPSGGDAPGLTSGTHDNFAFRSTTITCENPASPFAGSYSLGASGSSSGLASAVDSGETCAQGQGSGTITGGVTGSFTFKRVGTQVTVNGTISNGVATGTFVAELTFAPTAGPCVGGSGSTTATLAGTAVVEDAA